MNTILQYFSDHQTIIVAWMVREFHLLWGNRAAIAAWMDSRDGGIIQMIYFKIFGISKQKNNEKT
jgi:hypothetical protein